MKHNTLIIGINTCDCGSTGTIMRNTLEYASLNDNYDYYIFVPHTLNKQNSFGYSDNIIIKVFNKIENILFKRPEGFKFYASTFNLLRKIKKVSKKYSRCIIHFHNLHECNLNIPLLLKTLNKYNKFKFYLTLHDSWIFTGGCYCFNFIKCFGWKTGCKNKCPQHVGTKTYSPSKILQNKAKALGLIANRLDIVAVSKWMVFNAKSSFLKKYKIYLNYGESNLKYLLKKDNNLVDKYNLKNKKVLLTVSEYWNDWKGYKYIYEIADKLPYGYVVMVIGGNFDIKNRKNIIHINNVSNNKINRFYSVADVYISTSQDESLGLTTCEAQMCGVPIVAFGHGGIKETVTKKTGYIIGEDNNVDLFIKKVVKICDTHPFKKIDIVNNGKKFSKFEHAKRMLKIYRNEIE